MNLKDKMNNKYTSIAVYVIVTAAIVCCLGLIVLNAKDIISIILEKLSWVFKVSKPIVLGFIFAYLVEPVVSFFEMQFCKVKLLKKKQASCRTYAVLTTLVLVIIALVAIISLLVFSVTDQLRLANFDDIIVLCNTYMKNLNDFYRSVLDKLNEIDFQSVQLQDYIKQASTYIIGILRGIANNTLSSISNLSGYFTTFFFAVIIMIYFLIDGKLIKEYVGKVTKALCSSKIHKGMIDLVHEADQVFSGYIRGQLIDALVMLVLISISLSIIGVKFSVLIGVLAGIGNLIPYFGPIVAYGGTIIVCLLNGDYKNLVIGIIVLFIIQTVDGNIIGPKLLSKSIQIHPLLVIISLIFGSAVGGLLGMLLAVPVGAFIKVLFVRYIDNKLEEKGNNSKVQEKTE